MRTGHIVFAFALAVMTSNAVEPVSHAFAEPSHGPVDVIAYGAACDHVTDDAPAINRALDAARSIGYGDWSTQPVEISFPGNGKCLIKATLNFTGFKYVGVHVRGGYLLCQTRGAPCIDALGSRQLRFDGLTLVGDRTLEPTIGIQIGIVNRSEGADGHLFEEVAVTGYFSIAAYYNFASEVTQWVRPYILNLDAGNSYAVILDGYDHWNIASPFVAQTAGRDLARSFNDNLFVGGYIQSNGMVGTMWIAGTGRLRFDQTYSSNDAAHNVVLWFKDNDYFDNNNSAIFDVHFETPNVTDTFLLTGPATAPLIRGFRYATEQAFQASNSVFAIDPAASIRSVSVSDLDIGIGMVAPNDKNSAPRLFDDPAKWSVSGRVSLPAPNFWTEPASFSGLLCTGMRCMFRGGP